MGGKRRVERMEVERSGQGISGYGGRETGHKGGGIEGEGNWDQEKKWD